MVSGIGKTRWSTAGLGHTGFRRPSWFFSLLVVCIDDLQSSLAFHLVTHRDLGQKEWSHASTQSNLVTHLVTRRDLGQKEWSHVSTQSNLVTHFVTRRGLIKDGPCVEREIPCVEREIPWTYKIIYRSIIYIPGGDDLPLNCFLFLQSSFTADSSGSESGQRTA